MRGAKSLGEQPPSGSVWLLQGPPHAPASPCSAVRELLASLRDPYSRFVPPSDFAAMLKYDVSGVGLNLGTAEELANKTVGRRAVGVWV